MTQEFYKHKCPNCGKETINMNPDKKNVFCSKICQTNYKYGDKFVDDRYWKKTPIKE